MIGLEHLEVQGEVVVQPATKLEWQRAASATPVAFDEAVRSCTQSTAAGGRWRLPTRIELQAIVRYDRANPAIDAAAFPATPAADFWSSSTVVFNRGSPWKVSFADGGIHALGGPPVAHVRCVR